MKKLLLVVLVFTLTLWGLSMLLYFSVMSPSSPLPTIISLKKTREIIEQNIPDASVIYYQVSGNTAEELRTDINRQSTIPQFDGNTYWHAHWDWPGIGNADCNLGAATLTTQITVTLPQWTPAHGASPALVVQWNRYIDSLSRHEQGHVQLAQQGFKKMQAILRTSNCARADAELIAAEADINSEYVRYDAETRHGVTQGTLFP